MGKSHNHSQTHSSPFFLFRCTDKNTSNGGGFLVVSRRRTTLRRGCFRVSEQEAAASSTSHVSSLLPFSVNNQTQAPTKFFFFLCQHQSQSHTRTPMISIKERRKKPVIIEQNHRSPLSPPSSLPCSLLRVPLLKTIDESKRSSSEFDCPYPLLTIPQPPPSHPPAFVFFLLCPNKTIKWRTPRDRQLPSLRLTATLLLPFTIVDSVKYRRCSSLLTTDLPITGPTSSLYLLSFVFPSVSRSANRVCRGRGNLNILGGSS
ncbi:unnamed protein product [Lactuca saligna]|uniref:Uncharacterized protein n=1 Tax=Lactuca saligna TaxID=75948 RepID=A0AA35VIT8_LACSI|nr:unnamed protein product [Lactuca saligna]